MEKNEIKNKIQGMLENISAEEYDPFLERHFNNSLEQLKQLDAWLDQKGIKKDWTLNEKLSFLRNVEANIRTGTSFRRTQLSWVALLIALLAALFGFVIGIVI
ncbi:MAG: hypothetical protein WCT33_03720 [Patescibacteria group bacterium]|jgi:hypothetical protein